MHIEDDVATIAGELERRTMPDVAPEQADVDELRHLLDLLGPSPATTTRRAICSRNWMRDRGAIATSRLRGNVSDPRRTVKATDEKGK